MPSKHIAIRPATRADFEAFYGQAPAMTTRALAGEIEGNVVGMAGYYLVGNAVAVFTDFKEGLSKRDIIRGARAAVKLAKKVGVDLIAAQGSDNDALKHFGFKPDGEVWRLTV